MRLLVIATATAAMGWLVSEWTTVLLATIERGVK
jgi:hypothetical protein